MAAPVLLASAAMVTFWAVFQLAGVKVSVPPELTDRPELPDVLLTVTDTLEAGAADSSMPTVPVAPWGTESDAGLASTEGDPPPVPPAAVQLRLTGTASLLENVPWKPNEVLAPAATAP
jgi:hypothetical protein